MIKVALTGNIASGKSEAEKIIYSLGYKFIDTDKVGHNLLMSDKAVFREIKDKFKEYDILDENGDISREKLGKVVFSHSTQKIILEKILHPRIYKQVDDFINNHKDEQLVFVGIPLLFETKQESYFDKIIFISADKNIRLKRLMQRNNYFEEYAQVRIDSQEPEESKIKKSDYIIYNNSDLLNLKNQLEYILSDLNKL